MSYNVRVYDYPYGRQIRVYEKNITPKKEVETAFLELEYQAFLKNAVNPFTGKKIYVSFDDWKANWRVDHFAGTGESDPADLETDDDNCIERKERENMKRAKNRIFELSRANNWKWFITLTFDRNKVDASDYKLCCSVVRKFFKNMRERYAPDLRYLLLPELHKDGINWHFHGLLADCGTMAFTDSGVVQDGKKVYNISSYTSGFSTATEVEDTRRVSTYITKYVTKQTGNVPKGCKRYLKSNNLDEPVITDYCMTDDQIMDMIISVSDDITFMKSTECLYTGTVKYLEVTK